MESIKPSHVKSFVKLHEVITAISGVFLSLADKNNLATSSEAIPPTISVACLSVVTIILGVWGIIADTNKSNNYKARCILVVFLLTFFFLDVLAMLCLKVFR